MSRHLRGICFVVLFIVLLTSGVHAAKVYGTIYDSGLDAVKDVVVEVNSTPWQRHVSKYGGYAFDLDPGSYTLHAYYTGNGSSIKVAEEDVVVNTASGEYIVDLFIYEGLNLTTGDFTVENETAFSRWFYTSGYLVVTGIGIFAVILLLFALVWFYFKYWSKKKVDSTPVVAYNVEYDDNSSLNSEYTNDEDLKNDVESVSEVKHTVDVNFVTEDDKLKKRILKLIGENGDQMTQKELRKSISLSESKISHVVSELCTEGKLQKVKKGRVNVLVSVNS